MGRLDGKVAVITGGASGMGLATVERFVAEGAKVVFCDLPPSDRGELEARLGEVKARMHHTRGREKGGPHDGFAIADRLGSPATFVPADVTDGDELATVVKEAIASYGALDVLYNNAGVGGAEGSVVDCPEDVWDRIIDIDLKAVWRGIKLAAPHMQERGGSIISTASVAGLRGFPGLAAYGAAKAGVISLTRVAAMELAPKRIRVNCICPGGIVTPILYDSPLRDQTIDPDVLRQAMAFTQPMPRAGEPFDIANAALWLASDESSFVTGQAIVVDGGLTVEADSRLRGRSATSSAP